MTPQIAVARFDCKEFEKEINICEEYIIDQEDTNGTKWQLGFERCVEAINDEQRMRFYFCLTPSQKNIDYVAKVILAARNRSGDVV